MNSSSTSLHPKAALEFRFVSENTMRRSRKTMALDAMSFFARFFMAYIWISAGISKTGSRLETAQSVKAYEIFSDTWANWISIIIGPLEIAGGVLLLLGIFLRKASWVSTFVMVLFIIGLSQAWARGLSIDCGCFGPQGITENTAADYAKVIARDIVFVVLSLWTVYRPFKKCALYA